MEKNNYIKSVTGGFIKDFINENIVYFPFLGVIFAILCIKFLTPLAWVFAGLTFFSCFVALDVEITNYLTGKL